jgi:trehalose synthase
VIIDLVVNHTSNQHKWFQSARKGRDAPYHDYYVWEDEKPDTEGQQLVFPGEETSNWGWDDEAQQWYFHRFYAEQPDLNTANPAVRDEIAKIGAFWLALGVTGFRIDAVPFLLEEVDGPEGASKDPHSLLRELSAFLTRRRGDAVLLGEVNLPYDKGIEFFGDHGDELNMMFNFRLNQAMYLALARKDVAPLAATLAEQPDIPRECQWANFVRNHDELTLDQLTEEEREEVFHAFGSAPEMQVYGRGLRRRLPSMMDHDEDRVRLVYSLMFSLPGTPTLFYGEEIGMVENPDIPGRLSSRSPMQWSGDAHAGFSTAPDGARLCRPLPDDPATNVVDERRDPHSLLNWMERMIRMRKECPEFGWGQLETLQAEGAVLVHRSTWEGSAVLAVHNLGDKKATVSLPTDRARLTDLLGADDAEPGSDVTLPPYGFRWLRVWA